MYSPTKKSVLPLLKNPKCPNIGNKTHYERSEDTQTNNSHCEKGNANIKDKESQSTIKYTDSTVICFQEFNVFAFPEQEYPINIDKYAAFL